jgi:hypothetical protein
MDRPNFRTQNNIRLQPVNSTLQQNYITLLEIKTNKEIKFQKWIESSKDFYIENPDYFDDSKYQIVISSDQTKLDQHKNRKFAMFIVNFLKGKFIKESDLPKKLKTLISLDKSKYKNLFRATYN